MVKIVKVNEHATALVQAGQQLKIQFAYCIREDDVIKQTQAFAICRDYLGDFIWSERYKKPFQIYGMSADAKCEYLSKDATEFLIQCDEKKNFEAFPKWLPYLNDIEAKNELPLTTIEPVDKNTYYLRADKIWTNSVFLVSLYTFLIKLCCNVNGPEEILQEKISTNEVMYFRRVKPIWDKILSNIKTIDKVTVGVTGYKKGEDVMEGYTLHGSCGFVALSNSHMKQVNTISEFLHS